MQGRRQQGYSHPTSPAAAGGRALRGQQTPPPGSQQTPARAPASTNPGALKLWDWSTKRVLRPYPVSGGNIFFNPPQESEKDYLDPKNYANVLTCENSELCHRMGVGISILCGTQATVAKYFENFDESLVNNRTGIKEWAEILASTEGKKFLESCSVLNMGGGSSAKTPLDVNEPELMAHAKRFLRFLVTDNQKRSVILGKIMRFCGRFYLASAHLLEAFALINDPEAWGDKYLPKTQKEAWFDQPENIGLLREFIATSLLATVEKRRRAPGKDDLLQSSADDEATATQAAKKPKKRAGPPKPTDFTSSADSDVAARKKTRDSKKTALRRPRAALESSDAQSANSADSSPIAAGRRIAGTSSKEQPKKRSAARPLSQTPKADPSEVQTLRALVEELLAAQATTTTPKATPVAARPRPRSQSSTEQMGRPARTGPKRAATGPQPSAPETFPSEAAAIPLPGPRKVARGLKPKKKKRQRPDSVPALPSKTLPAIAATGSEEQAPGHFSRLTEARGLEDYLPTEAEPTEGLPKRQKQVEGSPDGTALAPP